MTQTPIRVLIVDDHGIVRKGTRALLDRIPDFVVVGEGSNGKEAVAQAAILQPDVILMDLMMPEMDGIEAIGRITASQPDSRILALTSFAADDKLFPAIKAGALGYMLKDADPEDLIRAIHQVHRGEPSLNPSMARKVLQELGRPAKPAPAPSPGPDPLTERELEVLQLVAQGLTNQQMAEQLSVAEVTIRTHVSNILSKLHLANRVQATLYALREGLTTLENDAE
ncbi:MAG: response regulator transcription factor [Ardenticatenaceae bacterium]|nr:response regulator transcription factor [Anaerolineales bacterium]MCB8940451.1 response regulator transcription factor [Ardenticatenaceae bacterium]MCB8973467.1 response regulator transcription factor [Ardenticatenaceae bacterium]